MTEFSAADKNAALAPLVAGTFVYISIHTVDPAGTGAGELAGAPYARVPTTWGAIAAGSVTGSLVSILMTTGVTVVGWGVWDALTGGNFRRGGLLPVPETFAGAGGVLQVTPTLTVSG